MDPAGNGTGYTFRFALEPRLDGYYLLIAELDRIRERRGSTIGIGADSNGVTLSNVRRRPGQGGGRHGARGRRRVQRGAAARACRSCSVPAPGSEREGQEARPDELAEVRAEALAAHRDLSGG